MVRWRLTTLALAVSLISGSQVRATPLNPILQVGIWQRFGRDPQDRLEVAAPSGSLLTVNFTDSRGQAHSLRTPQVVIGIVNQALAEPETVQRLVLSSHLSFESAEASARQWQAWGALTEIAQPQEWQVWAKRSAYSPEQFPQFLAYAEARGIPGVRIHREERSTVPLLSWQVDGVSYRATGVQIFSDSGTFRTAVRTYAGSVKVQPNAYGTYTVVNHVPLETYLRGVVPHEIGPGAPPAAIAAQAILARTYALKNRHRFAIDGYELCANTHCQVYRGLSETVPAADRAIAETQGQVLTYQGQLIDAVYFSTSGGITAAFEDVWDGDPRPYLRSIMDGINKEPVDLSDSQAFREFLGRRAGFNEAGISSLFRWQIPLTLEAMGDKIRRSRPYLGMKVPDFQGVAGLEILRRSRSGRVQELQIALNTDRGIHTLTLSKDNIRLAFPDLYSTMFDLQRTPQGYTFLGAGFGHGVGFSQYGSYGLARQGWTTAQILNFYYPGTQLVTLTPELVASR
ncbi:MAG: SpoIID/LytB domain-containing protein [Thermostichales cyanobacterium SRBZ-1_bins_19]